MCAAKETTVHRTCHANTHHAMYARMKWDEIEYVCAACGTSYSIGYYIRAVSVCVRYFFLFVRYPTMRVVVDV